VSEARGATIVGLMIGELRYQPVLNQITTQIVKCSVELWRVAPGGLLVCESKPMSELAARLGAPSEQLYTAIAGNSRHTTRGVAEWLHDAPKTVRDRPLRIVTHRLHVARARRVFAKIGLEGDFVGLDVPFDSLDRDWKLRTPELFRRYNALADVYCAFRGWV
jgi:hypothetical protein